MEKLFPAHSVLSCATHEVAAQGHRRSPSASAELLLMRSTPENAALVRSLRELVQATYNKVTAGPDQGKHPLMVLIGVCNSCLEKMGDDAIDHEEAEIARLRAQNRQVVCVTSS